MSLGILSVRRGGGGGGSTEDAATWAAVDGTALAADHDVVNFRIGSTNVGQLRRISASRKVMRSLNLVPLTSAAAGTGVTEVTASAIDSYTGGIVISDGVVAFPMMGDYEITQMLNFGLYAKIGVVAPTPVDGMGVGVGLYSATENNIFVAGWSAIAADNWHHATRWLGTPSGPTRTAASSDAYQDPTNPNGLDVNIFCGGNFITGNGVAPLRGSASWTGVTSARGDFAWVSVGWQTATDLQVCIYATSASQSDFAATIKEIHWGGKP